MTVIMKRLLSISLEECSFERRGFWMGNAEARKHLESVGEAFLAGYNMGLSTKDQESLAKKLNAFDTEVCGFAFEGAAMAMTVLDSLMPWRSSRVLSFLQGAGRGH